MPHPTEYEERMSVMKKNVKNNVLPHSEAKLRLYKDYLSEYLPILGHTPYVDRINLFDIFCGTGLYDDGKHGSPLIAASEVQKCIESFNAQGKQFKPIRFIINDYDQQKVDGVRSLLNGLQLNQCEIESYNLDADNMFDLVVQKKSSFTPKERNLVFVDPYGYSKIQKSKLLQLLEGNKTEIILFLPVAQMYRFFSAAQDDLANKSYDQLRRFASEFFEGNEKALNSQFSNVFDCIEELRKAFSFSQKFYTSAHHIQRDKANYYAVFFITPHIYGLEKFLEVKWKNDSLGKGFNQSIANANTLFGDWMEEFDKNFTESRLETILKEFIRHHVSCDNNTLYEFTLSHQFKIAHCNGVVDKLRKDGRLVVTDILGQTVKTKAYGINYSNYKERKIVCNFKMKQ